MVVKEMAIRATPPPAAKPSSPFVKSLTPRASFVPKLTPNVQIRTISKSSLTSTANAITAITTSTDADANAFTPFKDQIITSLTKVESTIDQIQEVGTSVLDFSQHNIQVVINFAVPILQKSGDEALKIASPVIEEVSKKTQEVIESSGIDTEPIYNVAKTVGDAAQQAFEGAKPIAISALEIILGAKPIMIVEGSGGLLVIYLLLPPMWSAISFNLRGYKGKLRPAQTLDLLSRRNYFIIDVRLEKDKNIAGVPLLPSTARNKMISVPVEQLPKKFKGLVRNTKQAEAGITALKISYLKMINRHCNIVIMDSYCDMAKHVARELTNLGFKNCWVMAGGFSGSRGWLQSYLGKESYNISSVEILSLPHATSPAVQKPQSVKEVSS